MTGRLTCSADEYLADPCATPSLSASTAKTLVLRSPAHAWAEHPRLGGERPEPTVEMDRGTLIHTLLLGDGPELEVVEADSWRTKAAREAREAARERGALPVLTEKLNEAQATVEVLRDRLADFGIVLDGESEVPIEFTERAPNGLVTCRAMLDHVKLDEGVIYDVKTISAADVRTCSNQAVRLGYDIQHAAYTSALLSLDAGLAGRTDFVFLFMETDPPYSVTPLRPDGALKDLGESRWLRAVELWHTCLTNDTWPHYVSRIGELETPAWALMVEEAQL